MTATGNQGQGQPLADNGRGCLGRLGAFFGTGKTPAHAGDVQPSSSGATQAPHMHQLGTDFLVEALSPDGSRSCLVDVEWDFRHQGTHTFRQPVRLAAGTEVGVTCVYDNSSNNPHQDHQPPIAVPWGRDAEKEMCQLTLGLTFDTSGTASSAGAALRPVNH